MLLWRSTSRRRISPYADERWRWCIYDVDALACLPYRGNYDLDNAAELNAFSCELTL